MVKNGKINNVSGICWLRKAILFLALALVPLSAWSQAPSFDWMKDVGAQSYPKGNKVYNVEDYGAEGDATKMNTEAIQKAIDECAANGGGIVTFPPGIFQTGSVFVKNNVDFNIPKGTMLIGSQSLDDYPRIDTRVAGIEMQWPAALINVVGQKNAAISGDGVIHGRGKVFWDKYWSMRNEYEPKGLRWIVDYDCERPRGILISDCSDVTIKGIVLYQPGFWSLHILYSDHVTVDGIVISNNIEGRGPSTDGVDIDSSSKILVQNSHINCNDDNFCLKAGRDADGLRVNRPCEYVVIRNCVAGHGDGLFTCGSETSGGIRNIVAYNMKGVGTKYGLRFKSTLQRGGTIENIYLYNIEMIGVSEPFVVDLNWNPSYSNSLLPEGYDSDTIPYHWKKMLEIVDPKLGVPSFKNIFIENVTATKASSAIKAEGMKDCTMDGFQFKNVCFEASSAGFISFARNWKFQNFSIKASDELKLTNNKNTNPGKWK